MYIPLQVLDKRVEVQNRANRFAVPRIYNLLSVGKPSNTGLIGNAVIFGGVWVSTSSMCVRGIGMSVIHKTESTGATVT